MHTLPYQNYIFDLYGTLVDIHTDEDQPAAGARDAGLDVLYVHSNLSPAGPLPEATFVLPEMDIPRMGAILAGEVQPS